MAALPQRDASLPAEQQGLFSKFIVRRADGSDAPGGKHEWCEYFVLDVTHDPHAKAALAAYAHVVEQTHPHLAADLRDRYKLARSVPLILQDFIARQVKFSQATFGPGCRTEGLVDHITKELNEVLAAESPHACLEEWVDVVLLALDGAWRSGFTAAQICDALVAKLTKNELRQWPDWRTAEPGKAIEHVRV